MRVVQCRFRKWLITVLLAFYWVLPAKATFPGVNGRITFARFFPATQSESIFSIKPDGGGEQQLTFDAANHFSEVSDWSPDALRIAFSQRSELNRLGICYRYLHDEGRWKRCCTTHQACGPECRTRVLALWHDDRVR